MPEVSQMPEMLSQWSHLLLEWVGFGTIVGLLAKAIMPGKDPGGAVTTLLMGIAGAVIGCGILSFFWQGSSVTPLSPLGFVAAVGGSFLLLLFYRLLSGHFFVEGAEDDVAQYRTLGRRRQRATTTTNRVYVDE